MLSIVGLHVVNSGGGYTDNGSFVVNLIWIIFYIIIRSSVNVFAMLSGYLYAEKEIIRNKNIVKLLITALFYYIISTAVFYACYDGKLTTRELLTGLFPPAFGKNWYLVSYIFVFFSVPYINLFIRRISKKTYQKFIILMFVLLSIVPTYGLEDYFRADLGYSPWWLMYCYIIGAYIKLYNIPKRIKSKFWLISILIIALCAVLIGVNMLISGKPDGMFTTLLKNYTSPNVLVVAVMLIGIFKNIKVSQAMKKFIKVLSATSFSVYIIHANPLVMDKLIENNFTFLNNYNAILALVGVVVICAAIYLACSVVDIVRGYLFKYFYINKLVDYIGLKLDNILCIKDEN